MTKKHKIYTEEEVESYFKKNKVIKYTVFNPLNDYEEYFFHDCNVASISIYEKVIGARYQSNCGMCDYHFPLEAISNIEHIEYEQFKYEITPSDI
ncbi:hypothetical protein H2O60_10620 [Leuconostoc mesenteroides]|uniref:hypothetical protein n=1 Tax=Leuconostoc mesenteroides TaxID=1245 RepID=UPI0015F72568|nr:hypothetical protein [Leuconostoc mesenteroides]MBA5973567.1 hypothetical protein [Leuconostoc mesenteroides]